MNTIEDLKKLKKDWDGYNANPISRKALKKAEELLSSGLIPFKEKHLFPTNDGTVIFENADAIIEITDTKFEIYVDKGYEEIEEEFSFRQKKKMLDFIAEHVPAV